MNPMTNVKNITKLNETELSSGSIHKKSWHDMYKDSAWIFIGGLQYALTEGDILAVFSQYGEIVNINLVRDNKTGKSKGFCFLCYSNQKSTVLAVDNFNGIKLCNRTIRVDHVANYKPPKENERDDEMTKILKSEGCAPIVMKKLAGDADDGLQTKKKKSKKEKKKKKRKHTSDANDSDKDSYALGIKKEKHDPEYDKYDTTSNKTPKVKHREKSSGRSKNESKELLQVKGNSVGSNEFSKKIKQEKESSPYKETSKDHFKPTTSFKSHTRERSGSSSDESVESDIVRRKHEESRTKYKHSRDKKKYKDAEVSSSSTSDDDSSTQSSDFERYKDKRKYSRKDRHRSSNENKSYQEENRHKHYHKSETPNYMHSKSRQDDKTEKLSDKKSKHRSYDRYDKDNKKSDYHKRKYDKR